MKILVGSQKRDNDKTEVEMIEIASEVSSLGEALRAMSTTSYEIRPECLFGLGTSLLRISHHISRITEEEFSAP